MLRELAAHISSFGIAPALVASPCKSQPTSSLKPKIALVFDDFAASLIDSFPYRDDEVAPACFGMPRLGRNWLAFGALTHGKNSI